MFATNLPLRCPVKDILTLALELVWRTSALAIEQGQSFQAPRFCNLRLA